jgi:hypothetical protein
MTEGEMLMKEFFKNFFSWAKFLFRETINIVKVGWYIVMHADYNWHMLIRIAVFFIFYCGWLDWIVTTKTSVQFPATTWSIWHWRVYLFLGSIMALSTEFMYQVLSMLSNLITFDERRQTEVPARPAATRTES